MEHEGEEEPSSKEAFKEGFWSQKGLKNTVLDEERQYIWNMDYFERTLLPLFRIKEDSKVVDVGCGLGFLCEMLSRYVPEGKVVGVDLDSKLIEEAQKRVSTRPDRDAFEFRTGDAYNLPVPDGFADFTVCQTLLMHLNDPAKAISEMKRATKKGGVVAAIERDYTGVTSFDTAMEKLNLPLEKRLLLRKADMLINKGKRSLGKGDNEIGSKVPILFHNNDLRILDVRAIDRVFWLIPPYTGHELELKHFTLSPEIWIKRLDIQKHFMTGGGTEEEWNQYHALTQEIFDVQLRQIENASLISVTLAHATITVAQKP